MVAVAMHEGLHRMRQLDPEGSDALMNFLYEKAEQTARSLKEGDAGVSYFEQIKNAYSNVEGMDSIDYIEEVAAKMMETVFSSPEEFNEFIAALNENQKAKSNWQKLVDVIKEILEDIWAAITNSKMDLKAKRQAQTEIDRMRSLLADAYRGAMKAADARVSEVGFSKNTENKANADDVTKFSLSPTKIKRLKSIILNLGKKKIKKVAGEKTIRISTDKFSVNKAIHSKKGRTDREVNARIKAIPEFEAIIKRSTFYDTDTNIVGLESEAKKGVIAMHYFETTHNGFDIEVLVRDKGKSQSLYEVKFMENKKSSQQSMSNDIDSSAPNGDVENNIRLTQNSKSVKRKFSLKDGIDVSPQKKTNYLNAVEAVKKGELRFLFCDFGINFLYQYGELFFHNCIPPFFDCIYKSYNIFCLFQYV